MLVCDSRNQAIRQIFESSSYGSHPGNYAVTNYIKSDASSQSGTVVLGEPSVIAKDVNGNFLITDPQNSALRIVQLYTPQPSVTPPVIGEVRWVTNAFGSLVTHLESVTNGIYSYSNTVAITSENQVTTWYTIGNSDETTADPRDVNGGRQTPSSVYQDGLGSYSYGSSLIKPEERPGYNGSWVIKAYSTAPDRKPSAVVTARFTYQAASPSVSGIDPAAFYVTNSTDFSTLYYTTNNADADVTESSTPYQTGSYLNIIRADQSDITFRAKAFRLGFKPSETLRQVFHFADAKNSLVGFKKANYDGGVGSTIVVPVRLKLVDSRGLRSLQFRVEITPESTAAPAIPNFFRAIDNTNLFINPDAPAEAGKTAFFSYLSYSITNTVAGQPLITRGLAISFIGTNANFFVSRESAIVGLLAIPIPILASNNTRYTLSVLNPSGTMDGQATPVRIMADISSAVTARNDLKILVGDCDTSTADVWYNAGTFGDGKLANNDVNLAFYASLGVSVPFSFTDIYDAMDAFPLDTATSVGGDGQIRYLDWQVILFRSLGLHTNAALANYLGMGNNTNDWYRGWINDATPTTPATYGIRVAYSTNAWINRTPFTADTTTSYDPNTSSNWVYQAVVEAKSVGNAVPGLPVQVPVYAKAVDGQKVQGLQFRAVVVADGSAPAVEAPAQFIADSSVPSPITLQGTQQGLKANETAAAWALVNNPFAKPLEGEQRLGYIVFTVPASAGQGASYTVHFANADGAMDLKSQMDFEAIPGRVWVGTVPANQEKVLPDGWKKHFFGAYDSPDAAANNCPAADGFANWQKYAAGLNPQKYEWHYRINEGKFNMRWFAEAGNTYVLERSADLTNWTEISSQSGVDNLLQFSEQPATGPSFYRVRQKN